MLITATARCVHVPTEYKRFNATGGRAGSRLCLSVDEVPAKARDSVERRAHYVGRQAGSLRHDIPPLPSPELFRCWLGDGHRSGNYDLLLGESDGEQIRSPRGDAMVDPPHVAKPAELARRDIAPGGRT